MYQDSYREDNVYSKYRNLDFTTCLIAGLGELELIPKWFREEYPDTILDIVEIDRQKKTSLSLVKVVYESIFDYVPEYKYDIIVMDIWYAGTPGYREEIEFLKTKYFSYLNEGGIMSFPMIDMHTIYSYVELQRRIDWLNRANA